MIVGASSLLVGGLPDGMPLPLLSVAGETKGGRKRGGRQGGGGGGAAAQGGGVGGGGGRGGRAALSSCPTSRPIRARSRH